MAKESKLCSHRAHITSSVFKMALCEDLSTLESTLKVCIYIEDRGYGAAIFMASCQFLLLSVYYDLAETCDVKDINYRENELLGRKVCLW